MRKRRLARKIKAIEYKGGSCIRCGYNKCLWALEFHHRKPKEKEFGLAMDNILNWNKIKNELDKCDLLCANCHREIEYEAAQG